ncbi:MAG TPA: methyltransferase [Dongiaceae bacterium]|nr:methyltransferase [Dongiaceae bacterium]
MTSEADRQPSPEAILRLGLGFWGSKTLLSAVELGVFTELAGGALDLETLRQRLDLHPRSARDFFDALVALGMLERKDGRYYNSPQADLYLDRAKPGYIGGLLEMANARLYGFWGRLTEALRSGRPQNEAGSGGDPFAVLYADPARLKGFLGAMTGASLPLARAIAAAFPWQHFRSFADIGCAQGGASAVLAEAHPHLHGIGFDLAPVRPIFEAYVAQRSLSDRLQFRDGDFFADPLPAADVIVMGHILHDWDLGQKRALIAKAYAVLHPGGNLLVYDMIIDDDRRQNALGLLMSLNMLIETPGGFDYTAADCMGWMRDAGFPETRVQPLTGAHSRVIGTK